MSLLLALQSQDNTGSLSVTLGAMTLSASGASAVTGSSSTTLDALTLTAAGTATVTGSSETTLGALTVSSAGTSTITGSTSVTLSSLSLSAAGTSSVPGSLSATLGDLTSVAVGAGYVTGAVSSTLSALTLVSTGFIGTPVPEETYTVDAENRSDIVATEARELSVDASARDASVATEARSVDVPTEERSSMSDFVQFRHAPGASRVYRLVWEDAATDSVVSETFTVTGPDSALTVSASGSSGINRQFRATGGTAGATYDVLHTVTFTSGDIDARTVRLVCTKR